jgi:hypothetical protein
LLGRSGGYLGTEVRCESMSERHYRVLDFWTSHVEFEAFRERFAAETVSFRRLLFAVGLLQKEEWLGAYYTGESDYWDEGSETTPA